jgi:hypothetical protein
MLPASVVATYPFVNSAVVVALGWIVLAEPITVITILGCGLVLAGAGLVACDLHRASDWRSPPDHRHRHVEPGGVLAPT